MEAFARPPTNTNHHLSHALRSPLGAGETVLHGRFTIVAPMVDEAPGAYFTAHDALTNTEAAVRVLLLHGPAETGGLVRLRHDLRRTAASPHPYILRVLDSDVTTQTLLLATEPRGLSLLRLMAARRLPPAEALTYALHIAGALGFIHTHGVAHGRLTPATVVIRDETARLADIGLGQIAATFADPWPGDLAVRQSYIPPEANYEPFPTPAMDIHHFGALLWEMLAGVPPPIAPAPLPPLAIPPTLSHLIARCLHPHADQRPTTMSEIIATIKAIKRNLEGKGPGESQTRGDMLRHTPPAYLAYPAGLDEQPTMQLARATLSTASSTPEDQVDTPGDKTTALPNMSPPLSQSGVHRLPTLRLKPLSLGMKLVLTGGILGSLIALFAVTSGTLLNITHAAPPPADAIVLHGSVTALAPRALPYRVTQTLVLGPGRTLRLAPGTTILFMPGTALIIAGGTLEAHGTTAAPTLLTATGDAGVSGASPAAPWAGIQLTTAPNGSTSHALLDGITLRAAGDGQSAAIACHTGTLTLVNSTQSDSLGMGVQTDANCWGEIAHTTFARDLGAAAHIASANLHFHDNTFSGLTVSLP